MAFVAQVEGAATAPAGSIACSSALTVAVGDRISVAVTYFSAAQRTVTVTDGLGNSFVVPTNGDGYDAGADGGIVVAHCTVTNAGSSTPSAAFSGAADVEFRGICARQDTDLGALQDADVAFQASPTAATDDIASPSLNVSTQPAWRLGFSFNFNGSGAPAAGTGFTSRTAVWAPLGAACGRWEDLRTTSTGSAAATFTSAVGAGVPHFTGQLVYTEVPPVIVDSVTPATFADNESGIDIAGEEFGASQGSGRVVISPVDDIDGEPTDPFPGFDAVALTSDTDGTSTAVNMPAGIAAGDLLLAFHCIDLNGTGNTPTPSTGWQQINTLNNGTVIRGTVFARIADGGANDNLTISSSAQDAAVVCGRIRNHGVVDVTTDITFGTAATGTSATPDPPNCNPGVSRNYLWVEVTYSDDDDNAATYWSTNYSAVGQAESAQSTTSCMVSVAARALAASSENPGTMALAASEEWVTQTLAIPPRAALGAAVEQTVTSWGDTAIVFTSVLDTLPLETPLFLFVENDDGDSNPSGFTVEFEDSGPVTLTVADSLHGHAVDSPALTQANALAVADALHAHAAESPTLSTANTLNIADTRHGHTVDSPTLTQAGVLTMADARHGHTADNLALTQAHTLAVADARHGHAADAMNLIAVALASILYAGQRSSDDGRVKIAIDGGQPANIGASDTTITFWIRAASSGNNATAITPGDNYQWTNGNVVIDRDRFEQPRAWGISLTAGRVTVGLVNGSNLARTIRGTTDIRDDEWHFVEWVREITTGAQRLYIDGVREVNETSGPTGDISYPEDAVPEAGFEFSDPFLVIGAEKHDLGVDLVGYCTEVHLYTIALHDSSVTSYEAPAAPDSVTANTAALYHFDEGSGTDIRDADGNQSPGTLIAGSGGNTATRTTESPFEAVLALAVNDARHVTRADNLTLTNVGFLIVVQDARHGHAADNLALTTAATLAVQEALHATRADTPSLVQQNVLAVADARHGHSAENVVLILGNALTVSESRHAHTADNLALTQANTLAVQEARHGHSVDNLQLMQAHVLVVQESRHAHLVENVTLSQGTFVLVNDARHAHSVDSPALVQAHVLAVDDARHVHRVDSVNLSQAGTLIVSDALHVHLADLISLRLPPTFIDPRALFIVKPVDSDRFFIVAPQS